jgi:hypothetical protein
LNIAIILLFIVVDSLGSAPTNLQVAAREIATFLDATSTPHCVRLKLSQGESTLLLRELAVLTELHDPEKCGLVWNVEGTVSATAFRIKKNTVKRTVQLQFTFTGIEGDRISAVETRQSVYTDTFPLNQITQVNGPGMFGFGHVPIHTPFRKWVEPLIVLSSIFSSIYLLYTIRT